MQFSNNFKLHPFQLNLYDINLRFVIRKTMKLIFPFNIEFCKHGYNVTIGFFNIDNILFTKFPLILDVYLSNQFELERMKLKNISIFTFAKNENNSNSSSKKFAEDRMELNC